MKNRLPPPWLTIAEPVPYVSWVQCAAYEQLLPVMLEVPAPENSTRLREASSTASAREEVGASAMASTSSSSYRWRVSSELMSGIFR